MIVFITIYNDINLINIIFECRLVKQWRNLIIRGLCENVQTGALT